MTRILGISGSLRTGSFNTALLRAAQSVAPAGVEVEVATLHGIPLYDADVEQRDGLPAAVTTLKDKVAASDAVLLVTPEYNNGVPGVFKNAIDWLSRPAADSARIFGVRHWSGGRLMVSRAEQVFDEHGDIKDEATREQLRKFVAGFAGFAAP